MVPDYWHKQTSEKPLFPDLLWSRPENKAHAGKLLIVGGNSHGFSAPAEAFIEASKAGAGSVRVILPDAVRKVAGAVLPELEFAPSTPSGSFGQNATAEILAAADWSDGLMLAGDFGHNSETAIMLEKVVGKNKGLITLVGDAVDNLISSQSPLIEENKLYVVSMEQLQKLAIRLATTRAITHTMDFVHLVDNLHELTSAHNIAVIVKHLDQYIAAVGGKVSATKSLDKDGAWQIRVATHATTWWFQNPDKPFEAITTAIQTTARVA